MDLFRAREPEPAVAWGLRDVAWAGLLSVVLFVCVVAAATWLEHSLQTAGDNPAYLRGTLVTLAEIVFLIPVWAFALRRPGVSWRDLGLRGFRPLTGCLAAIGFLYLSFSVNVLWGLVLRWLGWPGQPDVRLLFGSGPLGLGLAFVSAGIVAPLAEEVFFRGFAFPPLRRRLGLWPAIIVNAALFTALHFTPTVFPPLFLLGVLFCLLYTHTGSLWPGIILHASVNTFSLLVTYLVPAA